MKIELIGFTGNRQNHQDWALEIIAETDFEQTFFNALFASGITRKQMQPKASLLFKSERGISIMVESEDFQDSQLSKERKERLVHKDEV
jgi:hypothetical protein